MELTGKRVPLNHDRLDLLANYLRRGPEAERDYSAQDITWQGSSGSRSQRERKFVDKTGTPAEWERAINTAYAGARLGLVSMGEHSLCMARLITDPELGVHGLLGAEVLCRSALEVGARAAWMLDPAINGRDRVVRYFVAEFNSATEYDHIFALEEGLPRAASQRAAQAFESPCASLGLNFALNRKRWQYRVEGVARPSATEAVTELVALTPYRQDRSIVYSLLSGATHGLSHSLLRSYIRVGETAESEAAMERMVDHRLLEAAVGVVMMSYIAVLRRVVELTGWSEYRVRSLYGMTQQVLIGGPR
jgi:hypothetical protein